MNRCSPFWRCLRFGCPRCDLERRRERDRLDMLREIGWAYEPTVRRAQRDAERKAADTERERRENDPNLN